MALTENRGAALLQARGAELREVCANFSATLDAWAVGEVKAVEATQKDLAQQLSKDKAALHSLDEQRRELEAQVQALQSELKREAAELESLMRASQSLVETESEFPAVIKQLTARRQQAASDLLQHKNLLDEKRREKKAVVEELTLGVNMYKERLGLAFDRLPGGRLRCTFTYIDPTQDSREFYFAVRVDSGNEYAVVECVPSLNADLLADAEADLNRTQNFSRFVREMRLNFKKLC